MLEIIIEKKTGRKTISFIGSQEYGSKRTNFKGSECKTILRKLKEEGFEPSSIEGADIESDYYIIKHYNDVTKHEIWDWNLTI